jgi:outer membrane protein OmpA-like peptidoglycan-associated protein
MFTLRTDNNHSKVIQTKIGPSAEREAPTRRNDVWQSLALQQSGVQPKLTISRASDPYEREADRIADRVMNAPAPRSYDGGISVSEKLAPKAQRKCGPCEEEEENKVQRKEAGGNSPATVSAPIVGQSSQKLDSETRAFMEPRFGRDFSDVRVHTDGRADASARSLNSLAFTLGRDVAFRAGQYAPQTEPGRRLLAHELAHVVQQGAGPTRIQRSLNVDNTPPVNPQDPLSSMGAAAFQTLAFSEMNFVVNSLCDRFKVNPAGDVVSSGPADCADLDAVAAGTKPIGCCCLCALTDPSGGAWTIHVTGIEGPHTSHTVGSTGGEFFFHPRSSSFEFGAWNVAGARGTEDPVVVAGHELCGHGALLERGMHPRERERVDTDVHDPTVRIENLIRAEQGLPGPARGLATDAHRGESFAKVTVRNFPFNVAAIPSLPSADRDKIQLAKDFANANNAWVDIFGHSDLVGTPASKQTISDQRANNMRTAMTTGTRPVSSTISKAFSSMGAAGTGSATVAGNRFTRVEGHSDFDAIPGAAAADLRRVEIMMPTRPAGAEVPNTGTPTGVARIGQSIIGRIRRRFGNACDRLLGRSAFP